MTKFPDIKLVGTFPIKGVVQICPVEEGNFTFPRMKAIYKMDYETKDILFPVYFDNQDNPNGVISLLNSDALSDSQSNARNELPIICNEADKFLYEVHDIVDLKTYEVLFHLYINRTVKLENLTSLDREKMGQIAKELIEILEAHEVKIMESVYRYVKENWEFPN